MLKTGYGQYLLELVDTGGPWSSVHAYRGRAADQAQNLGRRAGLFCGNLAAGALHGGGHKPTPLCAGQPSMSTRHSAWPALSETSHRASWSMFLWARSLMWPWTSARFAHLRPVVRRGADPGKPVATLDCAGPGPRLRSPVKRPTSTTSARTTTARKMKGHPLGTTPPSTCAGPWQNPGCRKGRGGPLLENVCPLEHLTLEMLAYGGKACLLAFVARIFKKILVEQWLISFANCSSATMPLKICSILKWHGTARSGA